MFSTGQRVVCVDADNFPVWLMPRFYKGFPVQDGQYTIRDIIPAQSITGSEGEVAVLLEEIINPLNDKGTEPGYNAERFAPLQEDEATNEEELVEEKEFAGF